MMKTIKPSEVSAMIAEILEPVQTLPEPSGGLSSRGCWYSEMAHEQWLWWPIDFERDPRGMVILLKWLLIENMGKIFIVADALKSTGGNANKSPEQTVVYAFLKAHGIEVAEPK